MTDQSARLSAKETQSLETKLALPLRPGTGQTGRGIRLHANYFQVWLDSNHGSLRD